MTNKDYEAIAKAIRNPWNRANEIGNVGAESDAVLAALDEVAHRICDYLNNTYPNFDGLRFLQIAGPFHVETGAN